MLCHPKRRCNQCRATATHGARRSERCEAHALPNDQNWVEHPCSSCGLLGLLDERKKLCDYCRAGPRARLAKQTEVRNVLLQRAPKHPWDAYDRTPVDLRACGDRERPDFFWDRHSYAVVLEVDEHQHFGRPEECECVRMVNIAQSLGVPTYFLRFNPDAYRPGASAQVPLTRRWSQLLLWLRDVLERQPACASPVTGACVLRLFFDGDNPQARAWQPIDAPTP